MATERAGGSRRRPLVTTGTPLPEGAAAALDRSHPLPVRQWPITLVLGLALLGLAIAWFGDSKIGFKVGLLTVGGSLLVGTVLRLLVPEVGMLAIRSRFTDVLVLLVLGGVIVLLTLVAQPDPWLKLSVLDNIGQLIGRPRH